MKDTRCTRVSATVFHKHKYISNPLVTPEDAVMAAAGELATLIGGHMPHQLSETSLDELTRLRFIFKQALGAEPEPPAPPPASDTAVVRLRRSPRLTTSVNSDDCITAAPAPRQARPVNPPISLPRWAN